MCLIDLLRSKRRAEGIRNNATPSQQSVKLNGRQTAHIYQTSWPNTAVTGISFGIFCANNVCMVATKKIHFAPAPRNTV